MQYIFFLVTPTCFPTAKYHYDMLEIWKRVIRWFRHGQCYNKDFNYSIVSRTNSIVIEVLSFMVNQMMGVLLTNFK
jgi:hypothetical protein